ncbi:prostaglandin-H2 D-isomerase / glutathione transferase [Paragonimus westermani]|uniref:Prostaglandin-H2 D-isomerase / glutathione transferase n=1 Tax=Paragonimus westermani TaxID=34504 RepID=A0A5J4NS10_9TREM|nr:prostaglandin-H2 D-isomerase / glutathione transferase [Paragonimus westermani]
MQLTYFNGRGRAEYIRMVLHAADLEFEDHRIDMNDWPKIKPTIAGGQLPVLDVTTCCGKTRQMNESMAIARWFARKHQMMGSNDEEYYEVERVIGQCSDIYQDVYRIFRATGDVKQNLLKEFTEGNGPRLLGVEVTVPGLSKDNLPIFERHRETVLKKHAKLAAYMETRPTTNF